MNELIEKKIPAGNKPAGIFTILLAANLFTGNTDVAVLAIIPLNAVIVSTSANGAYAAILRATNKTE